MTDLVERLRGYIKSDEDNVAPIHMVADHKLINEAAERIEALEKERDTLVKEGNELRANGYNALRGVLTSITFDYAKELASNALILYFDARAVLGGEE